MTHSAYQIRWGTVEKLKEQSVAIVIAGTTKNRLIIEMRMDIINLYYIKALDMLELEERVERKKRRTRIVNMYDNHLVIDQA